MLRTVLVTGGAGYIGSHACLALIKAGYDPIILDNFSNSNAVAIQRLRALCQKDIPAIEGDIRDTNLCAKALRHYECDSVIHFAGLKAVGESQTKALEYYDVNLVGSHSLLRAMQDVGVNRIIFSSSATVYGVPKALPLKENHPLAPTNPYGQTKLAVERLLSDVAASEANLKYGILRYFNPVGADSSSRIGEDPRGVPSNLMPFIAQVAVGRREALMVFGNDYDTPDGTGVRDYIHVSDLADAHVKALEKLEDSAESFIVNLGTGKGYSVLDMIEAFASASGQSIPYNISNRRVGDVAVVYSDPSYAEKLLGWKAVRELDDMCRDHWAWQTANPRGYEN